LCLCKQNFKLSLFSLESEVINRKIIRDKCLKEFWSFSFVYHSSSLLCLLVSSRRGGISVSKYITPPTIATWSFAKLTNSLYIYLIMPILLSRPLGLTNTRVCRYKMLLAQARPSLLFNLRGSNANVSTPFAM
jgi:hypothetical protein